MNWYSTIGMGSQVAAGPRAGDGDAMCGNAVMYDATAGKILVIGGSIDYVCLPYCLEYTESITHMSIARRQCDDKCPYHHDRYRYGSSRRPDDQLDVLSKNLCECGSTSERSCKTLTLSLVSQLILLGLHLRWPRIWYPIF